MGLSNRNSESGDTLVQAETDMRRRPLTNPSWLPNQGSNKAPDLAASANDRFGSKAEIGCFGLPPVRLSRGTPSSVPHATLAALLRGVHKISAYGPPTQPPCSSPRTHR